MDEARQTKQFYPNTDKNKARYVMKLSRYEMTRFFNITTGHNLLNYHQSLKMKDIYSECKFCGEEKETFFHWATQCPRLYTYRNDYFLDRFPCGDLTWSLRAVLDFSFNPAICRLLDPDMDLEDVEELDY